MRCRSILEKSLKTSLETVVRSDSSTMDEKDDLDLLASYLLGSGIVAYHRALAHAVGDVCAGLLMSQFCYWTRRLPEDRDGWFYKTQDEILEETALTRYEQETARKRLRSLGLLEEVKKGVPAKLWFRVNSTAVIELLCEKASGQDVGKPHPRMLKNHPQGGGKAPTKHGGKSHASNTKTTAETSTQISAVDGPHVSNAGTSRMLDPAAEKLIHDLVSNGMNLSQAIWCATERPDESARQLEMAPYAPGWKKGLGAYLYVAIRDSYGPPAGYLEAMHRDKEQAEAKSEAQRQEAYRKHEQSYHGEYLSYLRTREVELQSEETNAYEAFIEHEKRSRETAVALFGKSRIVEIRKKVEDFDTEEQHLARFGDYFNEQKGGLVLSFRQWDQQLNPNPFAPSTPGE